MSDSSLPVFDGLDSTTAGLSSSFEGGMDEGKVKEGDSHVSLSSRGWGDFMLREGLMTAISQNGFEHPSPVQSAAIPDILHGKDIIVQGKSGMGKTAVFVLTILQMIDASSDDIQAVVVSSTRELAQQTADEFNRFSRHLDGVKVYTVLGGAGVPDAAIQKEYIRSNHPQIISATVGRLLDLAEKKWIDLSKLRFLVVDEFDKLFRPQTGDPRREGKANSMHTQFHKFFMMTPKKKQVMMFSATVPQEVVDICLGYMKDPVKCFIDQEDKLMLEGMTQRFMKVEEKRKSRVLTELLDNIKFNQCIIFVSNDVRAEALAKTLNDYNFPAIFSHSRLPTEERLARYSRFKRNLSRILVATDLWDRSLDIEHVNLVISYDLPPKQNKDEYLHRIGRAGRFGTKGLAIAFVSSQEDADYLEEVQKKFNKTIDELKEGEEIDASCYSSA